jgi:hypothetical protein
MVQQAHDPRLRRNEKTFHHEKSQAVFLALFNGCSDSRETTRGGGGVTINKLSEWERPMVAFVAGGLWKREASAGKKEKLHPI